MLQSFNALAKQAGQWWRRARQPVRPSPPDLTMVAYCSTQLCDKLDEVHEIAQYVADLCRTGENHPEYVRCKKFAADHHMKMPSICEQQAFIDLEQALNKTTEISSVTLAERPCDAKWLLIKGDIFDGVGGLIPFLKDEARAWETDMIMHAMARQGLPPYQGPTISEFIGLFDAYTQAAKLLEKHLRKFNPSASSNAKRCDLV